MTDIKIFDDRETLSAAAAHAILSLVQQNPEAVLCLATGDTPRRAYQLMVEKALAENIDMKRCTFVALDEWLGIAPENPGSCHNFLTSIIFQPLSIPQEHIFLFDAMTPDPAASCQKMDAVIAAKGGIDLMLVGVGMNGHVGFNEPGVDETLYTHVIGLDETTRLVGQKYFSVPVPLQNGITLGIQHLLESRTVIMMASGTGKAQVMKRALEGPVTNAVPASFVRRHPRGVVMLDKESAALLRTH